MRNERILFKNPNRPAFVSSGRVLGIREVSMMHFHNELEFLRINGGRFFCRVDNEEIYAKAGDIIFVNSNHPHSTANLDEDTCTDLIQFRVPSVLKKELRYLSEFMKFDTVPCYNFTATDPDYPEIADYVDKLVRMSGTTDLSNDYYVTANIYNIVGLLYKRQYLPVLENVVDKNSLERVLPVFDFVQKNYADEITLESMAALVNLNKDYFCRLFKKACGTTFTDYLNFVRVCKAEELLSTDTSISEIAFAVGFSSLSYFNQVFKKYKLSTPSGYKKQYVSQQKDI